MAEAAVGLVCADGEQMAVVARGDDTGGAWAWCSLL